MIALIAQITPHAVVVALSPMPIAALILLLLSNKARVNSILFLLGWVTAIFLNVGIFAFLSNTMQHADHKDSVVISSYIHAVLGIILLLFAYKQWRNRLKPGETPITPKWMETIETLSPLMAFVIAFSLITINAKNTIIDITTGVIIGQTTNTFSQTIIALCIFTFMASITIAIPVFAFLLLGTRLNTTLQKTKTWFIYNSATILFVLFLVLGFDLLCKAFI